MATVKTTATTANWSPEQMTFLKERAAEAKTGKINALGIKELLVTKLFSGKNAAQIRGKLSFEKLYEANSATPKPAGEAPTRKLDIVHACETMASMPRDSLASFEKASKPQLEQLFKYLTEMSDNFNANKL